MFNPYVCFMAEAEGQDKMVTTRTARINAVIKELRPYFNETEILNVLNNHNLSDITEDEWSYIKARVR